MTTPGQNIGPSNAAWEQVMALARSGAIPSGPGGSYLYPIAMMVSAGHSLDEAEAVVLNSATNAASDGGTDPANATNAATTAGTKAVAPQSLMPAAIGQISPHTLYLVGGAALAGLLLLRRR